MALRSMLQLLLAVRCLLDDRGYHLRLRDIDRMAAGNLDNRCGRTLGHHPLRRGRDHVVTCKLIGQRADVLFPIGLATSVIANASRWLAALEGAPTLSGPCSLDAAFAGRTTSLEILAHVIDLKLPWMTGYSRQVAQLARNAALELGLDVAFHEKVYCAALIHGMGRAAVPNMIWDTPGKLAESAWERVRLVPYWTGRAARQIGSLAGEANIASYAYERPDGSGYYREANAGGIP